jgi:hypothetical protein
MHSKNSPIKVQAAQRRQSAVSLRVAGRTYAQIADELGVSKQRAYQAVAEAVAEVNQQCRESAEELRRVECERLDAAQAAIWDKVVGGDLKAVETFLKLATRRARLLGLDAPTRTQVEATGSLASMTDAELLAEADRLGLTAEADRYRQYVTVTQTGHADQHQ